MISAFFYFGSKKKQISSMGFKAWKLFHAIKKIGDISGFVAVLMLITHNSKQIQHGAQGEPFF